MSTLISPRGETGRKTSLWIIALTLALIGGLLVASVALIPSLRSTARSLLSLGLGLLDGPEVRGTSQGDYTNILFLHHSTGEHIISQGGLREQLTAKGYQLWDHGYNWQGLRGPNGQERGYSYRIPNDNTDPDWLAVLFEQRPYSRPVNALSGILQHEVIVFKSCFTPTSHIPTDEQLDIYKSYYLRMRETIDQHPEKLFILLTQPPLNPAETNAQEAVRARALADWLASDAFLGDRANLRVFNSFTKLIDNLPDSGTYNMLREDYRNGSDSHPNQKANEEIVPPLVEFIDQSIQNFRDLP